MERRQERINVLLVGKAQTNALIGLFHVPCTTDFVIDFTVKILIRIDNSQLSIRRTI